MTNDYDPDEAPELSSEFFETAQLLAPGESLVGYHHQRSMSQLKAQSVVAAFLTRGEPTLLVLPQALAILVWKRSWRVSTDGPLVHGFDAYVHNAAGRFIKLEVTDADLMPGSIVFPDQAISLDLNLKSL